MVKPVKEWQLGVEDRTSGIYTKASPVPESALGALGELREITGEETVAVLFFARDGAPPESAVYPLRPKRLEQGYSVTHRLSCWLHSFDRATATEVPAYLRSWFPDDRVIVVPLATPTSVVGAVVVTRACAPFAADIRSFATDLALRLEIEEGKTRLRALRLAT
jgi:hypothetical protein